MTPRESWRRRIRSQSVPALEHARSVYAAYLDLYEKYPELCSPVMHDNAVTAFREIDAALRVRGVK